MSLGATLPPPLSLCKSLREPAPGPRRRPGRRRRGGPSSFRTFPRPRPAPPHPCPHPRRARSARVSEVGPRGCAAPAHLRSGGSEGRCSPRIQGRARAHLGAHSRVRAAGPRCGHTPPARAWSCGQRPGQGRPASRRCINKGLCGVDPAGEGPGSQAQAASPAGSPRGGGLWVTQPRTRTAEQKRAESKAFA